MTTRTHTRADGQRNEGTTKKKRQRTRHRGPGTHYLRGLHPPAISCQELRQVPFGVQSSALVGWMVSVFGVVCAVCVPPLSIDNNKIISVPSSVPRATSLCGYNNNNNNNNNNKLSILLAKQPSPGKISLATPISLFHTNRTP